MCVTSVVYDYYRTDGSWQYQTVPSEQPITIPIQIPPAPKEWDQESLTKLKELVAKAKELDELMGEKDCEDPEKAVWIKWVEDRLKKLEKSS